MGILHCSDEAATDGSVLNARSLHRTKGGKSLRSNASRRIEVPRSQSSSLGLTMWCARRICTPLCSHVVSGYLEVYGIIPFQHITSRRDISETLMPHQNFANSTWTLWLSVRHRRRMTFHLLWLPHVALDKRLSDNLSSWHCIHWST